MLFLRADFFLRPGIFVLIILDWLELNPKHFFLDRGNIVIDSYSFVER